jgi:hypothetical protein
VLAATVLGVFGAAQIATRECSDRREHGGRAESPPGSSDAGNRVD